MSDQVGHDRAFAAVDESPDDRARYAVLGDWLQQRGDPRGELIALQLLEMLDATQRHRMNALLALPSIRWRRAPEASWRWGFVERATLLSSVPSLEPLDPRSLWRHPSLRFVRALTLASDQLEPLLFELCASRPRVLHRLEVTSPRPLELSAIGAELPLRALSVSLNQVSGTLPELGLESITIATLDPLPRQAEALVWPVAKTLRGLELIAYGAVTVEHLEGVLALPHLERLQLTGTLTDEAVVDTVLDSPVGARLSTLDLSRSGLTERAARRVLARSKDLPRLSNLVLGPMI
jgi:uncharacterized protein (TIGR02996 family)